MSGSDYTVGDLRRDLADLPADAVVQLSILVSERDSDQALAHHELQHETCLTGALRCRDAGPADDPGSIVTLCEGRKDDTVWIKGWHDYQKETS